MNITAVSGLKMQIFPDLFDASNQIYKQLGSKLAVDCRTY